MASDNDSNNDSNNNIDPSTGQPKRFSEDTTEPGNAGKAEPVDDNAVQLAKVRNDFLYLYAEFENYKKNAIKERSDLRKYGCERLIVDLLSVLDIFETALGLEDTPENIASFRKGLQMTATELKSTLHRNGVEEIPASGVEFNPAIHEALSSEETSDFPPGHVSRVFKKPYKLHERVIRPGQVVVAKAKSN